MKQVIKFFALGIALFMTSCKGEIGPIGPVGSTGTAGTNGTNGTNGAIGGTGTTGATGTTGTTGTTGANGKDGNANVVYSEWLTPTWAADFEATQAYYLYQKSTANALITQEAIDKAVIFTYWKGKIPSYNSDRAEYELVERISPTNGQSFFKIPGRVSNTYQDFQPMFNYISTQLGVNYLSVSSSVNRFGNPILANGVLGPYALLPEFAAGKGFTYYNDLVKDVSKYRVIVVYGSTKGRLASVDMKDYAAVKQALNLRD